jgi:hypothetical protein
MKPDAEDPVVDRLLEGFAPPGPPPELRSRVLAAAREHIGTESQPDLWSRIWDHRGIRLAWAATVVLFLIAHILVGSRPGTVAALAEPAPIAESRPDEQFLEILRPVQISAHVRPIVGLFAASGDPKEIATEGNVS